jgi:hypothetical protein
MEGWNTHFHKLKKIWIYNISLNQFPSQEESNKEKDNCNHNQRERKNLKKLGGWWNIIFDYKEKWSSNLS